MGFWEGLIGKKLPNDNEDREVFDDDLDAVEDEAVPAEPVAGTAQKTAGSRFVLVKPEKFDDIISIANHVKARKTVVLNLESAGSELSRRIIDVLSGTAYAVGANIKSVAIGTYLIIPRGSEFSGESLDDMESGSFLL